MLQFASIPGIEEGDLQIGKCSLQITKLGTAQSLEEAWRLLPPAGQGIVVLADGVKRFSPADRTGYLVQADVVNDRSTWIIRVNGIAWNAWRWTELDGDSHYFIERAYRSSEPFPGREGPPLVYRQYWEQQDDEGLRIWKPIGARFCGFEEGN